MCALRTQSRAGSQPALGQILTSAQQEKPELRCYGADQIFYIWNVAKPLIQRALDEGSDYTIHEIYDGLRSKEMQLWMWGHEAALVTSIKSSKGKCYCLMLALGGEALSEWSQHFPIVENWARGAGAKEMRIYGRRGWSKAAGYDIDYTAMSKKL